ncbi:glycine betaine ABC transporter substrate-binding protein [Paenibacillus sp. CF384]|uniref:glycine betaine ABC transporter substrate-binding protein n=1 Tax=Paenibacillus sp. CF384 TaxID=1884382 RepID=UPI00089998BE|nr:glycine betaine ABC transporter substrate-binding protein [Paenibacillus sp. CF384]SDW10959.1 osmoprotectant transport system permease protein [Paenibacillus sp. CF384]
MNLWEVFINRKEEIIRATLEHIQISLIALIIAIAISIPTGLMLTRYPRFAAPLIGVASLFQTIPSLALLGFMIPVFGIGIKPAIVALTVYALLPILRNTYTGVMNVEKPIKEAGIGMGMTSLQLMFKVELPLALNVIMAGIRTATVMIIGVATLASLIGAGGLGDLIFRGISTVNTDLILAGTIPAALMALLFDYLLGRMEKALTPRGLLKKTRKMKIIKGVEIALASLLILAFAAGLITRLGHSGSANTVVVGGKAFTEQDILVHVMSSLIEAKTDLTVTRKPYLGGSAVTHSAIIGGNIDVYPEYTGTGWTEILEEKPVGGNPEITYQKVKNAYEQQFQITWLKPFGFNNTYTLALRNDDAQKLNINTISELTRYAPNLVFGATQEFLERPDGYKGLQTAYGIKFKETKGLDPGITYAAVRDRKVDVNDAYSTDGRITAFHLKVMEDDKQYFPPYYAAPIIREDTLKAHPELEQILNQLDGKLDEKVMSELNAKVDLEGQKAREVADDWLKSVGLLK